MQVDALYVTARQLLLDCLDALSPHREAVVLVGAQAVYQRVGAGSIAVAPFTTDGDLAIDPAVLAHIPPLEQALMASGFRPKTADSVGVWITTRPASGGAHAVVSVDLLVPASVSPGVGRRAARLPGHDQRAARIVKGLDGALVDADVMDIASLDAQDARSFELRVAGPAALLVAKVHKIDERQGTGRQSDKDALDVLRLFQGTETDDLATRYGRLLADGRSREAAELGIGLIQAQFANPGGAGVAMAVRSAGVLASEDEITASCEALASDLIAALKG